MDKDECKDSCRLKSCHQRGPICWFVVLYIARLCTSLLHGLPRNYLPLLGPWVAVSESSFVPFKSLSRYNYKSFLSFDFFTNVRQIFHFELSFKCSHVAIMWCPIVDSVHLRIFITQLSEHLFFTLLVIHWSDYCCSSNIQKIIPQSTLFLCWWPSSASNSLIFA